MIREAITDWNYIKRINSVVMSKNIIHCCTGAISGSSGKVNYKILIIRLKKYGQLKL
jgi:hypothetical protein